MYWLLLLYNLWPLLGFVLSLATENGKGLTDWEHLLINSSQTAKGYLILYSMDTL